MIMLIQRVTSAEVAIDKKLYNKINNGLVIFLGIHKNDKVTDINYLVNKLMNLRIFNDNQGKMNRSILDIQGQILLISQFTLLANTKRGLRPSFIESAEPKKAKKIYNLILDKLNHQNLIIKSGKFGANMDVMLTNNGPATFILDTYN